MMASHTDKFPELLSTIKSLAASAWKDTDIDSVKIDRWLNNFSGDTVDCETEMHHAFHLLAQLIYFGKREIDECLRVLFQEKVVYPFVQHQRNLGLVYPNIETALLTHLKHRTRFVGVGNPSESGASILYPFRQANSLPTELFSTISQVAVIGPPAPGESTPSVSLSPTTLSELIYMDDFCGTGEQVESREGAFIRELRNANSAIQIHYFLLFATKSAVEHLKSLKLFNRVEAVIVLDDDYKVFSANSHFYRTVVAGIDPIVAKKIMQHYGTKLVLNPGNALGYNNSQMLVSFEHNTPDNTLPVIWQGIPHIPWHPIFARAPKFTEI
jgi:hypothetical protein